MWIGVDDTDSRSEMCTTYIGFLLSSRFRNGMDSYPRLVRLNPNLPFKTRGNGAVSLQLNHSGKSRSSELTIGRNEGVDITIKDTEVFDDALVYGVLKNLIGKYAIKNDPHTNPGGVLIKEQIPEDFYYRALSTEISIGETEKILNKLNARIYREGNGRGIIGSAASIAWRRKRVTYELISYKFPSPEKISMEIKERIGEIAESFKSTFNNMDRENGTVCLFPKERTPVIYGIRGINPEDLMKIQDKISLEFPEYSRNFIIFQTNQGTDDHIVNDPETMSEYGSYSFQCTVADIPRRGEGGHMKIKVKYGNVLVDLIAFEPSKRFRNYLERLRPGDSMRVYGSMGRGNIKIEKVIILDQARIYERRVPECNICGERMKNNGNLSFVCPECGHIQPPDYIRIEREDIRGRYEPPVSARRHLSMPWKLEGRI